ncbi:MAG: hypothetical protein GXY55_06515 [Phycisphaerae bacterium]|nr:hypothetical protein [Phycisphaerae bacterium]
MKHSYLEVMYRNGRALAAYYYLPQREGDSSVRTERAEGGLLVNFARDGRAIGIEITAPSRIDLAGLNDLLTRLGQDPVRAEDLVPLVAA